MYLKKRRGRVTRQRLNHCQTSDEPFMPSDDDFIPFRPDRGANIRSIGGRNYWHRGMFQLGNQNLSSCVCNEMRTKSLGHRKGRTYFPIQKRLKPLLLLLGVAVASEDLWIRGSTGRRVSESDSHKNARTRFTHVASVGRGAVRHLRAHVSTSPHDFGHDGILRNSGDVSRRGALLQKYESWGTHFEVSQGDTVLGVMGLAEEEVPEAEFAGLCLEFFDDGDDRLPPRCVTGELSSR